MSRDIYCFPKNLFIFFIYFFKKDLDPNIKQHGKPVAKSKARLDYRDFGFTEKDLDREFYVYDGKTGGITNDPNKKYWKLRDIIDHMHIIYCKSIGYQFYHI